MRAGDTAESVNRLLDELSADSAELVLLFYSPTHDPHVVARILEERTGGRGLAGSTAGELGDAGFSHGSMSGIALHAPAAKASVRIVPDLDNVSLVPLRQIADDLAEQIGAGELDPSRHLWLMLFDGLSYKEELVTSFFARHAPRIPLVGGSLADESDFETVTLVHAGKVMQNAGAILLIEYNRPMEVLHHTHMETTEHEFTVTGTRDGGRVLTHLDGRPAKDVYAAALGVTPDELVLSLTGQRPLGYQFRGKPFPCSVMRALDDGLAMASAVQRGDRLNLLRPVEMVGKSREVIRGALANIHSQGATDPVMLLFHCYGRYLEAEHAGLLEPLFEALDQAPMCGLNTYGEQYSSMHMNHSIAGVLFG